MTEAFIYYGYPFVGENFKAGLVELLHFSISFLMSMFENRITVGYDTQESISFITDILNFQPMTFVPRELNFAIAGLHDEIRKEDVLYTFPINV